MEIGTVRPAAATALSAPVPGAPTGDVQGAASIAVQERHVDEPHDDHPTPDAGDQH